MPGTRTSHVRSTMQNDEQSASPTKSNSSGTSGGDRSQPLVCYANEARNSENSTSTNTVDDTTPLVRALEPLSPTCAIATIALPRVSASPFILSTSQTANWVPEARASECIETEPPRIPEWIPWFDGPDYQVLYEEVRHQAFDGYECIEKDMVRPNYRISERSIRAIEKYMDRGIAEVDPSAEHEFDPDYCVGFSKSELLMVSQRREGLTLGEAIQRIYMSRLRQSNKLLPMTKVYEGGWTLPVSGEQHTNKAGTVWLGDVVDSVNVDLLRAKNVTAMVSVHPHDFRSRGQDQHGSNGEVVSSSPIRWHLQVRLADSKEADMESEFDMIFNFIRRHVLEGHSLLVHCIAGLSRSVAVVRDFIQRIEVQRGNIDMTGTAAESYSRVKESRDETFKRLKVVRPGITEDNFKNQLDNSTLKICGLPRQSRTAAGSRQKSKEHGGGGYIGDSVAMVFFFYRLRPTPKVIELFEQRRADHARMERVLGKRRNAFSFPVPLIEWFEECIQWFKDFPSSP